MTATVPDHHSPRVRRRRRLTEGIVSAAARLFAEKGYEATTLAEIAEWVELSPKALYYYYPSKEAILDAVLERVFSHFEFHATPPSVDKASNSDEAVVEYLTDVSVEAVREIVEHSDFLKISFGETFRGSATTRRRHKAYMDNWAAYLEKLIAPILPSDGDGPDAGAVAYQLVDACFGLAVDSVLRGDDDPRSSADYQRRHLQEFIAGNRYITG